MKEKLNVEEKCTILSSWANTYFLDHKNWEPEERDNAIRNIFLLIANIIGTEKQFTGYIDTNRDFKNIWTKFVKDNDWCVFYVLDMYKDYEQNSTEIMFHPNGNTGCILVDDGYMFGIRCNHLIWIEGHSELFGNGYLVIGNHKGKTIVKFISTILEFTYNAPRQFSK